jgi:hypothetical protein
MLADDGIEFLDLHLFRHGAFVFGGRVEMTGAGAGNEFDFIAHGLGPLNFFPAFTNVGKHGVDAVLVDDPHTLAGNAQAYPAVLALDPETVLVQIRIEDSLGFVVSVRNVMAYNTSLARYLAYF